MCEYSLHRFVRQCSFGLQVRWSLHTLFYLLCNNEADQEEVRGNTDFEARTPPHTHTVLTGEPRCLQAGLARGLQLDWEGWEHNEARELIHLCRLDHLLL